MHLYLTEIYIVIIIMPTYFVFTTYVVVRLFITSVCLFYIIDNCSLLLSHDRYEVKPRGGTRKQKELKKVKLLTLSL